MSKDRLETFSDAVFAIILTLLVLELRAPNIAAHSTMQQYIVAMIPLVPKFISFVLTFIVVAINWVGHHFLFRHLRSVPLGIVWLNNMLLFWLCFLPFPTAMLGNNPTDQFPILLYGADSLFAALTFYVIRLFASRNKLFLVDNESARALGPSHSLPSIILYSLSILLAFINVYVSLVCFLLVPVLYFIPNMLRWD